MDMPGTGKKRKQTNKHGNDTSGIKDAARVVRSIPMELH